MLGGISQGGGLAMELAVADPDAFDCDRFVALVPVAQRPDRIERAARVRATPGVRGAMIVGELDGTQQTASRLAAALVQACASCSLDLVASSGHGHPPEFTQRLGTALQFVLPVEQPPGKRKRS